MFKKQNNIYIFYHLFIYVQRDMSSFCKTFINNNHWVTSHHSAYWFPEYQEVVLDG